MQFCLWYCLLALEVGVNFCQKAIEGGLAYKSRNSPLAISFTSMLSWAFFCPCPFWKLPYYSNLKYSFTVKGGIRWDHILFFFFFFLTPPPYKSLLSEKICCLSMTYICVNSEDWSITPYTSVETGNHPCTRKNAMTLLRPWSWRAPILISIF